MPVDFSGFFCGNNHPCLLMTLRPVGVLFGAQALALLLVMHREESEALFAEIGPTVIGERHDFFRWGEQRVQAIGMTQAEARLAQRGAHAAVAGDHFKDTSRAACHR
jgi:hypothetical protein